MVSASTLVQQPCPGAANCTRLARARLSSHALSPLSLALTGFASGTEKFITVQAVIPNHGAFTIRAQLYGPSGNYQVQCKGDNRLFFTCLNDKLQEGTKYFTLSSVTWSQKLSSRGGRPSVDLAAVYGITFSLITGPQRP